MATISPEQHRGNHDRNQRWARFERADLFERYGVWHTQGVSQRQATQVLDVPRSTLQVWRAYQDRLDACPEVVAFFHSVSSLAFLHRLVIALHVVCVEIGACGIRLVCLILELTGLNRFVGASYGTQQQVNRQWRRRSWRTATTSARVWRARCLPKTSCRRRMKPFPVASVWWGSSR